MGRLLFTTEDMKIAADHMARAAGDLVERIPTILPTGVLMPPALDVEATETAMSVAADLSECATFYGYNAADLAARIAMVIAEDAGGGVALGALFGALQANPLLSEVSVADAIVGGRFGAEFGDFLAHADEVFGDVTGFVDTVHSAIDNVPLTVLENAPVVGQDVIANIEELEASSAWQTFDDTLSVADAGVGAYQAWGDGSGEVTVARAYTALATGGANLAISDDPVLAGANVLSGGAVQADADMLVQIEGGAVSGAIRGYETGGLSGAIAGGLQGADQQMNNAADEAASGQFGTPVKLVSEGVNWFVDKAYGPVSGAISDVSHAVSSTAHCAEHLASRGVQDIESVL